MDKDLLKKILENKNKKKSFCLISRADTSETSLVKNKDIEKHKFSKLIKKAINEDKLILEEINWKEWIFNPFNPPVKLIIVGSSVIILFQFLIHIGVNIRMFPTTGMTLPFLSYGGSSIIGTSILAGIILYLTKRKIN